MSNGKSIDQQIKHQQTIIRFCKKCVVSNQRPRIIFDEDGVCSACRYAEEKNSSIDWALRKSKLEALCDKYRRSDGRYDIIVPCSGGKDASYVAHLLKTEYGMHPLTITWAPFIYTDIGRQNYDAFINSGFSNLLCHPNKILHRKLARTAFEAVGDAWQPFTYGQTSYAFHIALGMDIKLVFFGENGEAEYSGASKTKEWPGMPWDYWSEQYFKGVTVHDLVRYGLDKDLISVKDFDESDLTFYAPPNIEVLKERDIQFHWLGYYHKWLPQENYYYSAKNTGFCANPDGRSEGTYSKYASLDDRLDGFHYYLAYLKFGIGRATSDAAHEIRDGHITREEGIALVKKFDGEFPKKYFNEFLDYLSISEEQFWHIANSYRPSHIWTNNEGNWTLKHPIWNEAEQLIDA
ncbi:MAG: N-acetyl sugar amidotransferase [Gammaproteobacteria bacterium]|jgi:N-acetyl sugar amidotransferase|nr:N-acetyl sugar amidotransferase [Gammaproteobacteria bacterium]